MRKYKDAVAVFITLLLIFQLSACGKSKTFEALYNAGSCTLTLSCSVKNADPDEKNFSEEELSGISSECREVFVSSLEYLDKDRKSSPLYEINSDVDAVFDCDEEIISVLRRAESLCKATSGAFQPFGEEGKFQIGDNEVRKTDRSAVITLSALSESYALEKAADSLEGNSIAYGVLTAGNSVAVFGSKPKNEKFNISVEADGKNIGWFCIPGGCVASVDAYGSAGEGCGEFSRVAVYASDGLSAAAFAEAIWLRGIDYAKELHSAHASSFAAVAVLKSGEVYITDGAEESELFVPFIEEEE